MYTQVYQISFMVKSVQQHNVLSVQSIFVICASGPEKARVRMSSVIGHVFILTKYFRGTESSCGVPTRCAMAPVTLSFLPPNPKFLLKTREFRGNQHKTSYTTLRCHPARYSLKYIPNRLCQQRQHRSISRYFFSRGVMVKTANSSTFTFGQRWKCLARASSLSTPLQV